MKICIVGGVAGGAGAATKLRRLDEQAEIILFEKGEDISYANCGLPYYIGGEIKQKEALLVTPPALLRKRFRIDVRTSSEVTQIHPQEKVIQIRNHLTGESYTETYDKLVLSPGASPKKFSIEGIDLPGIFTVRNVRNTLEIDEYIQKNQVNSCVVAGGGFIGVEMAENLRLRGMEVTLVEFTNQIMAPLDREMANILHQEIISKGVNLKLSTGVSKLESQSDHSLIVSLTDQSQIHCGMVVLAMGVTPENGLAQQAGLKLSVGNSIQVNEFFQTSNPDIYAVGDAIAVTHGVSGEEALISLAGPANRQGRSVAANVLGQHQTNGKIAYGSSVVKVFDLIAASVGLNEKQLAKSNQNYLKTYVHPFSHATYYPCLLYTSTSNTKVTCCPSDAVSTSLPSTTMCFRVASHSYMLYPKNSVASSVNTNSFSSHATSFAAAFFLAASFWAPISSINRSSSIAIFCSSITSLIKSRGKP